MGLGKASPNPLVRAESFAQSLLDGAERSLMGHYERCAIALQIQGCTSPPPAFCVSVAGLLSRVPVLAAYAHKPEPSQAHPPASREAADQGTYRVYAQWEEEALELPQCVAIVRGGDCTEASQDCRPRGASVFVEHQSVGKW